MSYDDYPENTAAPKGGSVWPWILLTVVVVVAAVGMFAFDTQKQAAMAQAKHLKDEVDQSHKHAQTLDQQRADLEKQLGSMKAERDELERQKNEATLKVEDLTAQLALAKKGGAEGSGASLAKGKKGKGGKRIPVVVMKGHRR